MPIVEKLDDYSFTVIIATYNRRNTVGKAIQSAIAQSYPAREIIVVDDASNDGTAHWISRNYPGIRLIVLSCNRGAAGARNVALGEARSDFVAFLDSDDWWESDYLHETLKAFHSQPDAVMAVSDINMCLQYESPPSVYVHTCRPSAIYASLQENLLRRNFIATMSCMAVRREAVAAAGFLDETLRVVHDQEWYIRLAEYGTSAVTGKPLVWRTIGNDNLVSDLAGFIRDSERFWSKFFNSPSGVRFRRLKWDVRAGAYEGFAMMCQGRGLKWMAAGLNSKAFLFTCCDLQPNWNLARGTVGRIVAAIRSTAGVIWRRFRFQ